METKADGVEVTAITDVIEDLQCVTEEPRVTVGEIVAALGERTFGTVLLIPALIMVSPISGIPGSPTIAAIVIALIVVQMLLGNESIWLPGPVARCSLPTRRLNQALDWLKPITRWVDKVSRPRLRFLAVRPMTTVLLLICLSITALMPLMELMPFVVSIAAAAIAILATAIMRRDGVLVLIGLAVMALAVIGVGRFMP